MGHLLCMHSFGLNLERFSQPFGLVRLWLQQSSKTKQCFSGLWGSLRTVNELRFAQSTVWFLVNYSQAAKMNLRYPNPSNSTSCINRLRCWSSKHGDHQLVLELDGHKSGLGRRVWCKNCCKAEFVWVNHPTRSFNVCFANFTDIEKDLLNTHNSGCYKN